MELTKYSWWGEPNEPPEHLKTKIKRDYRKWYREFGFIERDRVHAVKWARQQLALDNWVILDTETTGLYDAEIVEIAVVDPLGEALLNTLVKPTIPIPTEVIEIHGITDEGDCLAGLDLLKNMAADSIEINCSVPIPEKKR
jgi:DNA polymerase III alpha subunit (gram-positive type)